MCGGEVVEPAEVEEMLSEHPAVAEAAVIGVPDDRLGEVGLGVVVLNGDWSSSAVELVGWLELRLDGPKVPKSFVFERTLPRDASGELKRAELLKRYS